MVPVPRDTDLLLFQARQPPWFGSEGRFRRRLLPNRFPTDRTHLDLPGAARPIRSVREHSSLAEMRFLANRVRGLLRSRPTRHLKAIPSKRARRATRIEGARAV